MVQYPSAVGKTSVTIVPTGLPSRLALIANCSKRCGSHTRARGEKETETSQSQVIEAQMVAERSEIAERDDRTAIRINGMNEPTAGADRPNERRRAEEGDPGRDRERGASLASMWPLVFPTSFSFNGVKTIRIRERGRSSLSTQRGPIGKINARSLGAFWRVSRAAS
jgi:hypothetical protein